jgi:hypothetical protein
MAVLHDTPEDELYELRLLALLRLGDWQAVIDRIDAELVRRGITPPTKPDASK